MEIVLAVIAGLALAILTPPFKNLYSWLVRTYSEARSEATASKLAPYLIREINGHLGLNQLREDIAHVKREVTINGGETLKDRVLSIERQIETLITDR